MNGASSASCERRLSGSPARWGVVGRETAPRHPIAAARERASVRTASAARLLPMAIKRLIKNPASSIVLIEQQHNRLRPAALLATAARSRPSEAPIDCARASHSLRAFIHSSGDNKLDLRALHLRAAVSDSRDCDQRAPASCVSAGRARDPWTRARELEFRCALDDSSGAVRLCVELERRSLVGSTHCEPAERQQHLGRPLL